MELKNKPMVITLSVIIGVLAIVVLFFVFQTYQSFDQEVSSGNTGIDQEEKLSQMSSSVLIFISIIFLVFMVLYTLLMALLSKGKIKVIMEQKSDVETFSEVAARYELLTRKGQGDAAMKIFNKLQHLYGYMSPDDKAKVQKKWDSLNKKRGV